MNVEHQTDYGCCVNPVMLGWWGKSRSIVKVFVGDFVLRRQSSEPVVARVGQRLCSNNIEKTNSTNDHALNSGLAP